MKIHRRWFIQLGATISIGLLISGSLAVQEAYGQQALLPGTAILQFVDPLPNLDIVDGQTPLTLKITEFQAPVMPTGFVPATDPKYDGTWVWGYRTDQSTNSSYLGPVIIAKRGVPTQITWVNNLGDTATSRVLAYKNSTDQTLHWADPLNSEANTCAESVEPYNLPLGYCAQHYEGPIPTVAHLHGGEVPPVLDGGPDAWFTSDGKHKGHAFYSRDGASATNYATYRYPNVQEAAPLWFHDHTLGLTRLNVYAGLAGGYLIIDPDNPPPAVLPPPTPLVIQDRMFDTNGQLFFPAGVPYIPNPSHPFWVPEFIGNTIAVNGKVWPYLKVESKRYRFLFLNGSNARGYELFLVNPVTKVEGPPIWQIGTDGGYLDAPVKIDPNAPKGQLQRLVMLPGERADVIIDFSGLAGKTLLLRNIAKAPYPGGETPDGNTTGRVMQFRVVPQTSPGVSYDPASGGPLRKPMVRLVDPAAGTLAAGVTVQKTRQLTLNEVIGDPSTVGGVAYPGGPLEILVNNTELPGTPRDDFTPITTGGITAYYSELPHEGDTEIWEIVNLTADAHPIHLHLVQFQLMNRQAFDVGKYETAYAAAFPGGTYQPGFGPPLNYNTGNARALGGNPDITPFLRSPAKPPAANEAGWKDTVVMFPGEVTRIAVRWAPTDLAVTTAPRSASYPFNPDGGHGYVWHCHIIDHEDNEMMRPTSVQENSTTRRYIQGTDY